MLNHIFFFFFHNSWNSWSHAFLPQGSCPPGKIKTKSKSAGLLNFCLQNLKIIEEEWVFRKKKKSILEGVKRRKWALPIIIWKFTPQRENRKKSDGSPALSLALFFAMAQVRPTLKIAKALKCSWALEAAGTAITLIIHTQEMVLDWMIVPENKPRPNIPRINETLLILRAWTHWSFIG